MSNHCSVYDEECLFPPPAPSVALFDASVLVGALADVVVAVSAVGLVVLLIAVAIAAWRRLRSF